ncbi:MULTISPECIES: substrate-binding periplasmic protein [Pseudoalteromonas]|nr:MULTISPECIES: transporter substrate-binding domain-containing protein [Pseudoalteromonas]MCF6434320.1 transporter substrate-binding domain-containing protein [Pseudoalteromonas sp. MMG022]
MTRVILAIWFSLCLVAMSAVKVEHSEQIIVAASPHLPPYVIQKGDDGIQLQILKQAFAQQGITNVKVLYMPNKRAEQQLLSGEVDIALNFPANLKALVHQSNSLLSYQNVAVSLRENAFKIDQVSDLKGKSVLAFQNAPAFLDAPFKRITKSLLSYEEVVNQEAQIAHLMKRRVDVIVLERRIFLYYLSLYERSNEVLPFRVHAIFSEAPRPAHFSDALLKAVFDEGLAKIKQNGQYQAIMEFDGKDYSSLNSKQF